MCRLTHVGGNVSINTRGGRMCRLTHVGGECDRLTHVGGECVD